MVYEAVKVELFGPNNDGNPIRYTCASGTAIAKGTLLKFSGDNTVAAQTAVTDMIAGIAAHDKSGSDYSTTISAWTDGVFEMKCSGAVTLGNWVGPGGTANTISGAAIDLNVASGANIFGYAREAGSADETINVRVKL